MKFPWQTLWHTYAWLKVLRSFLTFWLFDFLTVRLTFKHMKTTTLHQDLLNAYTVENLNNISLTLIRLYKDRQIGVLRKIAAIINDFVEIEIQDDGKGFSKFMMLYHPDRIKFRLDVINRLAQNEFSKIPALITLLTIFKISTSLNCHPVASYILTG